MKSQNTPAGLLILGALVGTVLGAAVPNFFRQGETAECYGALVGSFLGVVAGLFAELACLRKLISIRAILIVSAVLVVAVLIFWQPHPARE